MAEETFRVNHLLEYEIDYEFKIRKFATVRNVAEKRKILGRALAREKENPNRYIDLKYYRFTVESEQREINQTFASITDAIIEFADSGGDVSDHAYQRIKSRINHVSLRISRIGSLVEIEHKVTEEEKALLLRFSEESLATCLKLEVDLSDSVKIDNRLNREELEHPVAPIVNVAAPIVNCARNLSAVAEFNLKFNGDSKSLYYFLERVSELAQSRKVCHEDLFNSAVELFTGDAFVWYRSIKQSVNNWDELVNLLKRDFLNVNYDEEIWEQIKKRKQKRNESVVIFVAHMDTLFNRLSRPPAECTKVKNIRQNLLTEYITPLALIDIETIAELVKLGKKLEESNIVKLKNHPITSHVANLQVNQTSSKPFVRSRNFNRNKNDRKTDNNSQPSCSGIDNRNQNPVAQEQQNVNRNSSSSKLKCWNCGESNHTFYDCRAKRKVFCFKCGLENVKVSNCPKCSKNE
jgi:Retrotransposon gag protein